VTETGLIIGQAVFLLLLFIFIAAVVRASVRALRTAEIEVRPPNPDELAPQHMHAPTTTGQSAAQTVVGAAAGAVHVEGVRKPPPVMPADAGIAAKPEIARAAAGVEPHLIVTRSTSLAPGTRYDVAGGASIGRSRTSRIPVTDQFISHTHARVFRRGHFWFVEDLGSLNGTFVNGTRISGEQQLHLRDEIRVGETVLTWEE
jgi:hypothetical protein